MGRKLALSWSGGKDSCLTLDVLTKAGDEVLCLITTVPIETGRTFGHGEKMEMIRLQSESIGIPVHFIPCTYEKYSEEFVVTLKELKATYHLDGIAFGDLYLDGHREWGEKVAEKAGLAAVYPLWTVQEKALELLRTFVHTGYQAKIIRVREDVLDEGWLGRTIDRSFFQAIQETKSCPMGESGEYHTFVYDGPLFTKRICWEKEEIISLETTFKLELLGCSLAER
ncbi:diphthine--ammonia ligase [Cytobacillus spongiae]|jgi:uncharacterized protein (TIGR00290 family)|uniref:Dph6-related ATP pyrophosphatase n=1 Tax=Cytobacillus spongiae TaxID=2901381 RepID=UPI001F3B7586|nr:diphthine--ammonia ligase [Cytobacillus spongiae]UII57682.1 diphthine--ammonia ligase [Cytobacillus spongiae]